ncbi:MAG: type II secretion system protein GspG [Planctomycetes bacterium]|nr:type II secretion system protein GspG [Planctomycetota bacterium]
MTLHTKLARHTPRRAFTLMEMLIVVAIIVILAGVGTFYILPQFGKAKEDTARIKAYNVAKALTAFYKDHDGNWPGSIEALTVKDEYGGPYIGAEGLTDPWGKTYQIDISGQNHNGAEPDVFTTSPDGKVLGNWGR